MSARSILVVAHSGCLGTPPNSEEYLEAACRAGVDSLEVDVRFGAGDDLVLSHDPVAPGSGRSGGPLSLDACLDFAKARGIVLNLDIKQVSALPAAAAVVRRKGLRDLVVFSGLDREGVRLARAEAPDFRYLLNADAILPTAGYGLEAVSAACSAASEYGCCGLNLEWRAATPLLAEYSRSRFIPLSLWTPDEPDDIAAALALRPYSITTNRPDLLAERIAESEAQQ